MSQQWPLVGETVPALTGPGIEPRTPRTDSDVFDYYANRPAGVATSSPPLLLVYWPTLPSPCPGIVVYIPSLLIWWLPGGTWGTGFVYHDSLHQNIITSHKTSFLVTTQYKWHNDDTHQCSVRSVGLHRALLRCTERRCLGKSLALSALRDAGSETMITRC